jgi:hypothetical protein
MKTLRQWVWQRSRDPNGTIFVASDAVPHLQFQSAMYGCEMKTRSTIMRVLVLLVAIAFVPIQQASGQAETDQRRIAQQLLGSDKQQRSIGLEAARVIGASNTRHELRTALIRLLEMENRVVAETLERGATVDTVEDPEFISALARIVADLRDPVAIPALAGALSTYSVIAPLADFGEQAAPAVLAVVRSSKDHYAVEDGLRSLRFMIEGPRPLSAATLREIALVTEQRLSGKQAFATLWYAIDLASVLKTSRLQTILQSFASDPKVIVETGNVQPQIIRRTQQRAIDRLTGVAPPPRQNRP